MWVFMNNAMLSVVAHRERPEDLLVRARVPGDIQRVFPLASVAETPKADYLFRAVIPRSQVAAALAASVSGIGYDNFKASIDPDDWKRAASYARIWAEGQRLQPGWYLGDLEVDYGSGKIDDNS